MSIGKIAAKLVKHDERRESLALELFAALQAECGRTSQADVARKLGVSGAYLSDVLHGRRGGGSIGVELARKIAEAFE